MAKTRPGASKRARARQGAGGRSETRATSASSGSEQQAKRLRLLMESAWEAMTQGDQETAMELGRGAFRALCGREDDGGDGRGNVALGGIGKAAVLALLGEIRLEAGDVDEARALLQRAADLDAEGALSDTLGGGADKFLYLAQLSEEGGRDSLAWFRRGLAALQHRRGLAVTDDEQREVRGKMAQVACAMAEVWMTDLSYEDECEAECEALMTEATLLDPDAPDVWQTLASVRVSQNRVQDARAALQRSFDLWHDLPPSDPRVPAFSVRVSLVRLLLTVGWIDKAAFIARERLLREDDEAVEVWYLAGYAYYLLGQELRDSGEGAAPDGATLNTCRWRDAWADARRCLGRCLRQFALQQYEDVQLGDHARSLLDEVVKVVGPISDEEAADEWVNAQEEEGEEGEEGDWTDEDGGGQTQ